MDAEITAAVAAEEPAMVELLEELVSAPTMLGAEAAGQEIMRRAFTDLGSKLLGPELVGAERWIPGGPG